ncbi:3'-5' exonuclease [Limosilactobacillus coleohominis]|uniref:3'-5' exonuclease n=1 Tax=Limosilactobacillus coleohominis TaxID=181675 RepID=UPI0015B92ED2|nr:exonuclease domain-containing protein [Limosilactobacillus coleohominis]MDY5628071.1 3'-5' exonuclease [Limosilactobacillus coleohominis]
MNFIAMDFETASPKRFSACSLSLVVVRHNQIVDEFYSLINPQTPFSWRNTQIHGIHESDVVNAPTFPDIWQHINPFFAPDKLVIAHNATFDNSVLKNTLQHYQITLPAYQTLDTLRTSQKLFPNLPNHKLNTVADALNIELNHHHNALDDAQACADILIHQAQQFGAQQIKPFIKMIG